MSNPSLGAPTDSVGGEWQNHCGKIHGSCGAPQESTAFMRSMSA